MRILTQDRLLEIIEVRHTKVEKGCMQLEFYNNQNYLEISIVVTEDIGNYILQSLVKHGGADISAYTYTD